MPPPDKFDDRWYLIGAILLVALVVVLVALFQLFAPTV